MLSTEEVKANLNKAKKALFKYYKDNGLDPSIDFSKDPIHGEMVTNLILRLNRERDKLLRILPIWKMKNILTNIRKKNMAKKIKEEKKAKAAEESSKKVKKTAKKAEVKEVDKKPKKGKAPLKYDYPLIDGREMTSAEKKKYRMEQRKLQKGDAPKKEKKEKKAKAAPAPAPEAKPKKKVNKEEKPSKDKKKKKKVHKEED